MNDFRKKHNILGLFISSMITIVFGLIIIIMSIIFSEMSEEIMKLTGMILFYIGLFVSLVFGGGLFIGFLVSLIKDKNSKS